MRNRSLILALALLPFCSSAEMAQFGNQPQPSVMMREVTALRLPGAYISERGTYDGFDSNSPLHWDNQGRLHVFASVAYPYHTAGADLFSLINPVFTPERVQINANVRAPMAGNLWLEATYRDFNGVLYGWYHNERRSPCADPHLTIPRIGAMVSLNEGKTWQDLGIVLQASDAVMDCATQNYYFAGGEGDFTVVLDQARQFFYFFFDAYHDPVNEQGICVARLAYADRNDPVGKVWKWHQGNWREPGLNGRVSPIFPPVVEWHRRDANALWGPAVHYNTYLDSYVMLLNHAINGEWAQEGIYVSFNKFPGNPFGWSTPLRLPFNPGGRAYPEVVGVRRGETDKVLGQTGRLFLLGESNWELIFLRPNEADGLSIQNARPSRHVIDGSRQNLPVRIR